MYTIRGKFLRAGLVGAAICLISGALSGFDMKIKDQFDIEEMTVMEMQDAMKSGKVTSKQLVRMYLDRIRQIDGKLNSIIEINPDAIKIAEQMDKERAAGKVRSMMHGIPLVIKDNIDTADKMKTTAGSLALVDAPTPKQDAFVVKQMRAAGAVLIGKTNLSEWANFRSENSSSGWSGRGGQTHNPYILDRSPCGSSSGSGVAAAANLTAVAVGTETDGSVVCPASINGIVGIKPTLGLVSRSGIIPIAHSQDTAGPMARTVTDAVILLNAMVGMDSTDSITSHFAGKGEKDYTKFLDKTGLKGARIGVVRQYFGKNPALDSLMEENLKKLENAGATIVDVEFPHFRGYGDDEYEVLLYEFKADLNKYLQARGVKYNSLEKLIEFNKQNAARSMPYFGQEIFEKAQAKEDLNDSGYKLALMTSKVLTQDKGIDAVMDKHKLDALVAPSNSQSWLIDLIMGDSPTNYVGSSSLAAVSGYPNITVPSGFLNEMPIGMSFFGRAFSEPTLIKIAYSWEQASNARQKPKYLETYR
ncbi:MAG: amidase [Pyrinomonadaceae bacterium]|nr:amidase [Pyrinomonadaceae bacterium]